GVGGRKGACARPWGLILCGSWRVWGHDGTPATVRVAGVPLCELALGENRRQPLSLPGADLAGGVGRRVVRVGGERLGDHFHLSRDRLQRLPDDVLGGHDGRGGGVVSGGGVGGGGVAAVSLGGRVRRRVAPGRQLPSTISGGD